MKQLLNLLLALAMVLTLSFCNKDDDPKPGDKDPTDTTDTTSNVVKLTPEQNKELLQTIGVQFVNEMSAMQQTEGVQALTSLGLLVEAEDDDPDPGVPNQLMKINKAIIAFAHGRISANQFGALPVALRTSDDDDDDFESLQELFDEATGTYDWNAATEEFDYTDNSSDKIIFKYPTPETGTSNNTTLTFSNYSSVQVANPIDEEYTGDLPTSLDVELKLDGVTQVTYGFEVDYNSEGVPEKVETALFVNPFTLSVDLTNNKSKIGTGVDFSNGTKTLIATSVEFNGDFSDAAIEAAEEDEEKLKDVIHDANFSFTLLDLKMVADVDFANFYPKVYNLDTYYDDYDGNTDPKPDLEANAEKLEAALNNHVSLTTSYVSTGKIAAEVEWYTFVESEEYCCGTDYSIELGARMIFEDGSKVDLEDYLETGFGQLEGAINDLLDQISEDIGEDLEHIEF